MATHSPTLYYDLQSSFCGSSFPDVHSNLRVHASAHTPPCMIPRIRVWQAKQEICCRSQWYSKGVLAFGLPPWTRLIRTWHGLFIYDMTRNSLPSAHTCLIRRARMVALILQVIFCKWAQWVVALLRKETCKIRATRMLQNSLCEKRNSLLETHCVVVSSGVPLLALCVALFVMLCPTSLYLTHSHSCSLSLCVSHQKINLLNSNMQF